MKSEKSECRAAKKRESFVKSLFNAGKSSPHSNYGMTHILAGQLSARDCCLSLPEGMAFLSSLLHWARRWKVFENRRESLSS